MSIMREYCRQRSVMHSFSISLIVLSFVGLIASTIITNVNAQSPHAAVIELDGGIQRTSARFLERALGAASGEGATVAVIILDTPGGLFESTREMVQVLLESQIPAIVYVSPSGARAASAGTFILAAGHIAAMAPGTNVGAASPVGINEDLPPTLGVKAKEDAAAFLRSIAEKRNRNSEALAATVTDAKSYSALEAVDQNIIDLVANDLSALLRQINGRTVELSSGPHVLQTSELEVREMPMTTLEIFIKFLSSPNIIFFLLTLGALGLLIEFLTPGLIGPGVLGIICLALAFVGLGNLPVNWVGLGLLGLAIVLVGVELQAPGTTVFGIAGLVAFLSGGLLLFGGFVLDPTEKPLFQVGPVVVFGVTAAAGALLLLIVQTIRRAQQTARIAAERGISTMKDLIGEIGIVTNDLLPSGTIRIAGQEWTAVSISGDNIQSGAKVAVVEADGLTLRVSLKNSNQ